MDEQRLILVVEDDDATRAFLVENLAADGFRAAGATSAGEGVRAIEVRRPSLVLLDLALEGGQRARPARPGAARRRARVADRPGPARDRADRAGGGGGPRAELRPRGRRPRLQAVPVRGAARTGAGGAAARRGPAATGAAPGGGADRRPEHPRRPARGKKVELAAKEFALLHALAEEPTRVYGKNELLRDVWGFSRAREHAHPRRARLPAAEEAAPVVAAVGGERARCRLQADRGAVTGSDEQIARAEHELRGAATALALACEALRRDPAASEHAAVHRRPARPPPCRSLPTSTSGALRASHATAEREAGRAVGARRARPRGPGIRPSSGRAVRRPRARPAPLRQGARQRARKRRRARLRRHSRDGTRPRRRRPVAGPQPWPRARDRLGGRRGAGRLAELRDRGRHGGGDARSAGGVNARRRRGLLLLSVALASGGLAASQVHERERSGRRAGRAGCARCWWRRATCRRARGWAGRRSGVRRVPARFVPPDALASGGRGGGGAARGAGAPPASYLTRGRRSRAVKAASRGRRSCGRGERAVTVEVAGGPAWSWLRRCAAWTSSSRPSRAPAAAARSSRWQARSCCALGRRRRAMRTPTRRPRLRGPAALATLRVTLRQAVYLTAADNFAREIRLLARPPGDRLAAPRRQASLPRATALTRRSGLGVG